MGKGKNRISPVSVASHSTSLANTIENKFGRLNVIDKIDKKSNTH